MIVDDGSKNLLRAVNSRLSALAFHIREYCWIDTIRSMKFIDTRQKNIPLMLSTSSIFIQSKFHHGLLIGCLIKEDS